MWCQHGSNEINIIGLPEDEKYVDEIDTRGEPLPGQVTQPMHIGRRSMPHMHEAPDGEAENADSWHLRREGQTAQHSAAVEDNIGHSRRLHRGDETAWRSAATIMKSSQLPPPSPALPIASRVTRNQGNSSVKESTASIEDPFTYEEAMESIKAITGKEQWRKKAHRPC
jgi:hypothetical protein